MKCKVENNELKAGCGWGKAEMLSKLFKDCLYENTEEK